MIFKSNYLFEENQIYRRKTVDQVDFEATMGSFLPDFLEIFEKAFEMTIEERSKKSRNYLDRNYSAVVNYGNIKGLLFDKYPEYVGFDSKGRLRFQHPKLVVYFKKLNDELLPSNVETMHSNRLHNQLCLDYEEPWPVVWAGYTVDKTWCLMTGMFIVCIDGKQKKWFIDLSDYGTSKREVKFTKPSPNLDDVETLVKVKDDKKQVSY